MAFIFDKSTPATGAEAIFNFKTILTTAGWTVLASSDGTTYNSSGDQITVAGSGAGGMANTNAWFRLRSPTGAGAQEFTFQRGSANTLWRVKRSRTAGFTGGTPGISQTASATDENIILGGGTDASPTFITLFAADGGTYRWNVGADNTTPFGFWAGSFSNGTATTQAALVLDPLFSTETLDADKFVVYACINGSSAYSIASLCSTAGTASNFRITSQNISSAPGSNYSEFSALRYLDNITNVLVPGGLVTNPITTRDESFPMIFARVNTLANAGFKGISTVMRWTGTPRTTGDTLTVTTTRDRIIYGSVSLPWDGSVPVV